MTVGTSASLSELLEIPLRDLDLHLYEESRIKELQIRSPSFLSPQEIRAMVEQRPDTRFLSSQEIRTILEKRRERDFRLYETSLYLADSALKMTPEEVARAFALKPEEVKIIMSSPVEDKKSYEKAYRIFTSKPVRPPSMDLAYSVNNVWPKWGFSGKPTLTDLEQITGNCEVGEKPYASGYVNAWRMVLNPMGEGNVNMHTEKVVASDGSRLRLWTVNNAPIRVPNGVSALMIYESCVEDSVRGIVQRERDRVVAGPSFYFGPSVGFSLVGTGDAALKLAGRETVSKRPDENRLRTFLEVAQSAYNACGFEKIDYVQRRLDETDALRQGRLTGRLAERDWRPPHGYVHL